MRVRQVRVRPPWRSSESWSLRVSRVEFDPLAYAAERAESWRFVFAVGAQEAAAEGVDVVLEFGVGEAFVADHELAWLEYSLEQFRRDDPLGSVGGRELEARWESVGRAEQVEPEAPEPAAVGAAVP